MYVSHLVEKFSYKLEVGVFRFLVDDTVPLLSHEQTNGNCQLVVDQRVLQTLRALAGVFDLKFGQMEHFESGGIAGTILGWVFCALCYISSQSTIGKSGTSRH